MAIEKHAYLTIYAYTCTYYYTYKHASDEKLVLINITLLFTSSKTSLQVLRDISIDNYNYWKQQRSATGFMNGEPVGLKNRARSPVGISAELSPA